MKKLPYVIVAGFLAGVTIASAATEHAITQKGRKFSESEISIKNGDTLVFVNDDTVAHNIYSTSTNNEFNLGSQAPGSSTSVTFDKAGEIDIICAIHPVMKMKVSVVD